jgi:hypothetical protein
MEFSKSLEVEKGKSETAVGLVVAPWWKEVSSQANSKATPGKIFSVGNYLLELAKNSLGDGKGDGKITAVFDDEKIKIVIEDFSIGEKEINLNMGGSYGMKEAIEYADEFAIEAKGAAYEKDRRGRIEEVDESEVRNGSRVTFVKYYIAPPAEEAEETFRGRNFGERM